MRRAALRRGVDPDYLVRVARCESRLDPAAGTRYYGLFQFDQRTWDDMAPKAGEAGQSPWDPRAASEVAAWAFATGQASHWPRCRYA